MKMAAKWDLVISVVFLGALGLWAGPLGWGMGDVPPQEGDGVGRIQDSFQVIVTLFKEGFQNQLQVVEAAIE